jgi:uncharacterized membrane protein required for colicin V production
MWLDLVALLVLGLFVGLGALRGALASGLGLVTLGVGYGAAIWAAPRFADSAAELAGAPAWLGMPLAGTAGFFIGFAAMGSVSAVLCRLARRGREGSRRGGDRLLGGVFGAVRGGLMVLLLAYLALWIDVLRTTEELEALPELGDSAAAAAAGSVVEAGVQVAMADAGPAGRVVARMAGRPSAALGDIQALMEHPDVLELRGDRMFWTYVEYGNVDAALNRGSFLKISYDSALRRQLGELGLIDAQAVEDPQRFREASREVLAEVGPRIRGIKEDPDMQDLMQDPDVLARVQSGDSLALLGDARFQAVVARALGDVETP